MKLDSLDPIEGIVRGLCSHGFSLLYSCEEGIIEGWLLLMSSTRERIVWIERLSMKYYVYEKVGEAPSTEWEKTPFLLAGSSMKLFTNRDLLATRKPPSFIKIVDERGKDTYYKKDFEDLVPLLYWVVRAGCK